VKDLIDGVYSERAAKRPSLEARQRRRGVRGMSEKDMAREIKRLEKQMLEHAATWNSSRPRVCAISWLLKRNVGCGSRLSETAGPRRSRYAASGHAGTRQI
jgi:hypothetical protein